MVQIVIETHNIDIVTVHGGTYPAPTSTFPIDFVWRHENFILSFHVATAIALMVCFNSSSPSSLIVLNIPMFYGGKASCQARLMRIII